MRRPVLAATLITLALAGHAHADTIIAGGNVINQTWTVAGSPYIVQGDVTIPTGSTLTIEPGVQVMLASTDGQASGVDTSRVEVIVRGTMNVNGTAAQPVTMRGASAVAGSWYGVVIDPAATGAVGTWANLVLEYPSVGIFHRSATATVSTSAITLQNVGSVGVRVEAGAPTYHGVATSGGSYGFEVSGAGSATFTSCVARNTSSMGARFVSSTTGRAMTLTNCTLNANGSYGVYSNAASSGSVTVSNSIVTSSSTGIFRSDFAAFSVTHSNVWGNSTNFSGGASAGTGTISANPLYVSPTNLRLTSNSPSRFGGSSGNDMGALPYTSDATPGWVGTLWTPVTFTAAGSPYMVSGDLTVGAGVTVTMQPGATLVFAATDQMAAGVDTSRTELVVRGTLAAIAAAGQPIVLRGASPVAGSWYGVVVETTATGEALRLRHAQVEYPSVGIFHRSAAATVDTLDVTMTSVGSVGVRVEAGSPLYRGVMTSGGSYGFEVSAAGSATFSGCVARNTSSMGARFVSSTTGRSMTLTNCTFNANGSYGVYSNAASSGSVTVQNTIVTNSSTGIFRSDFAAFSVTFSNVWGNSTNFSGGASAGTGTISANPLYVSPTNLRLTSNSPSRFGSSVGNDMGALPYTSDPTPGWVGTLWTNTTFTAAGGPYMIPGDLTVGSNVMLTIQPGAALVFAATDQMAAGVDTSRAELVVQGVLNASGTTVAPIQLSGASPVAGSWYGIVVDPSGMALTLANVQVNHPSVGIFHRAATASVSTSAVTIASAGSVGVRVENGNPTYNGIGTSGGSYGFEVSGAGSATFTNCLARNTSSMGARFVSSSTGRSMTLTNCTLNANGSYGVYSNAASSGAVTVTNSIVTSSSTGVFRSDFAAFSVTYSNVWNNSTNFSGGASAGTGTISQNPQYVAPTDLRLQGSSVCIDAGTSSGAPATDIRGATRPLNGDGLNGSEFDMGAYEFALVVVCGNGAVEPGEVCDSGSANGMYGACNATCTGLGPRCGDGTMNGPEQCDDANGSNTDACLTSCLAATCGDGHVRAGIEACDDGNTSNTDACVGACVAATCGDGFTRTGVEACDDGNTSNTDACLLGCIAATCGDGFTRTGVEQCDDGNASNGDACVGACMNATCGDTFVRTGVEACDDGNTSNTDGCVGACQVATCGDTFVRTGVEACDDGNASNTDGCVFGCVAASCGDGFTWAGMEECDDANMVSTDSCLLTCRAAICGDGVVRAGVETCDDGNTTATDACTATCQPATCGDGITWAGMEECDDGNAVNTDACVMACAAAACGDGFVRAGVEACDDGNLENGDGCTNACVSSTCGDGVVQAGAEECDDGNTIETDGCRNSCLQARCGDGVVAAGTEACDDGNTSPGDGCGATCMVEAGPDGGTDPMPDDAGGCCSTGAGGRETGLLGALAVLLTLRRRRRARR